MQKWLRLTDSEDLTPHKILEAADSYAAVITSRDTTSIQLKFSKRNRSATLRFEGVIEVDREPDPPMRLQIADFTQSARAQCPIGVFNGENGTLWFWAAIATRIHHAGKVIK